jgi:hypothetical protein
MNFAMRPATKPMMIVQTMPTSLSALRMSRKLAFGFWFRGSGKNGDRRCNSWRWLRMC